MKLKADLLKRYTKSHITEYKNLTPNEVAKKFMYIFKVYLENELEENKCSKNPQKFLISSAKIGMPYVIVFQGHIPQGYEDLLIPYIKEYLIKVFDLDSFLDFGLKFRYGKVFQSIRLTWC